MDSGGTKKLRKRLSSTNIQALTWQTEILYKTFVCGLVFGQRTFPASVHKFRRRLLHLLMLRGISLYQPVLGSFCLVIRSTHSASG
ncbi:hypothetical protein AMECASPLE_002532 [Ameca splendens]|uniref:Uncharacterized protein n=1 Tax=Ameca splendens TaxID=208324 RepID=A0ABV1A767_9TELE